ncbi:MAG TPA: RluA family pseudouridine synthase [Myxococcales bacterium]|jgi:23S rRNA pseudouridine1911/1915/1917 synthase|nr:RluA family pseudouridine synthase [Myxococcales bacterium]
MDDSLVQYEVEPNYAGWTLADYILEKLKRPMPADRLERMLRSRALVHAETELLPETKVWPGLRFSLRKRSPGDTGEPLPLRFVFEDEALLVVDKPAGLAIHPTARYHVSTLTWALEARHKNAAGEKPDPAHRLDRETSGLVACGRNSLYTRNLKAQFAGRQVSKSYLALVEGHPVDDGFAIDYPLKVGGGRVKVKVNVDPSGAASVTSCEVLERYQDAQGKPLTLLRCIPLTGRQHQIRAHLHAAGFPLVGDKLYGPSEEIFLRLAESGGSPAPQGEYDDLITQEERAALRMPRQALHAATLSFAHPITKEPLHFEAPLPEDIAGLIATLRPL